MEIEGVVEKIIYRNEETGYCVFAVSVDHHEITCTAQTIVAAGQDVKLSGDFVVHPAYGEQFRATQLEQIMPKTTAGMEKYLASGTIKGIGPARAKRIVEEFGEQAFDVIENNTELLSTIKGISAAMSAEMGKRFRGKAEERNTMMYLQNLGLTMRQSEKIFAKFKGGSIRVVSENPYVLAEEIYGIGFKIADQIAERAGVARDSRYRVFAGVKHVLGEALGDGHVYLPKKELVEQAAPLLTLDMDYVENHILEMHVEGTVKQEKIGEEPVVYLDAYYHAELFVAHKLLALNSAVTGGPDDIEAEINKAQEKSKIDLAESQKTAVREALANGVFVMSGGPGTGKTTTINIIIRILEAGGKRIVLAAPTGRAAKRMSEATGREASTIHRLLGIYSPDKQQKEESDIEADCIIIDEASMVDIMLMCRLLKSIRAGTRLVLVGDVNQLPSVGPGNVLRDIINSGKMRVVYLDVIFRQSRQSAIVMNAHRINQGEYPALNEKDTDFYFINEHDINNVVDTIAQLAAKRLPRFLGVDPVRDIQILTPQRKSGLGVQNLNVLLQKALNPPSPYKKEYFAGGFSFREGDKVMQIKNNYSMVWRVCDGGEVVSEGTGIFNGDEGIIEEISLEDGFLRVRFYDERVVDYEFSQVEEIVPAYAVTIHKSQGSEYDVVILPIHSGPPMLLNRNLLYTAITRAKRLVVIVGITRTLHRMVDNVRENVRYSSLEHRIVRFYRQLYE